MISAGEFRNGVTFDIDGTVFQIIEFQHVKPGKGAAFVRTKIRNVISGAVLELSLIHIYGEMPRKWIFQTWLSPTEGFGQTGREE